MSVRQSRGRFIVDTNWPDGVRTRAVMPSEQAAKDRETLIQASLINVTWCELRQRMTAGVALPSNDEIEYLKLKAQLATAEKRAARYKGRAVALCKALAATEASGLPGSRAVPPSLQFLAGQLKRFPRIPRSSSVYFLVKAGEVVYVGQTTNLTARLSEHIRGKQFDQLYYLIVPQDRLDEIERFYIDKLKPKLNRAGLGPFAPSLQSQVQ